MSFAYTIKDQHALYFVTFTVHQWVDVFSRKEYRDILIENLRYCQHHKGLKIYAWVIMGNHCHLIVQSEKEKLSDIIRDFKKYTAKTIYRSIENNPAESRKEWLLKTLMFKEKIWFWEEGYHGEEIFSEAFFKTKAMYIHQNPVRAGIVEKEEEYLYSSAGDFYGVRKGLLDVSEY
ncbi:transposase [Arachidicoccus ginsenosidimutans]|uniref:REP-associated tyrosine transposase n=1 Tax=Arachidicoccus sp. BS20 TaxID=1850526 RepID=UPI0007F15C52|nr:transposase [Arachidicoccus sp. BS20]ANI90083.1 transposase [Arachidicoccus sp. BS20]